MSNGLRVVFFVCAVTLIGISVFGFDKINSYEDLFKPNISYLDN